MKQSTIIFGTLVLAFVIYITLRGQLPDYFSLFTGATSTVEKAQTADKAGVILDVPAEWEKTKHKFDDLMSTMGLNK